MTTTQTPSPKNITYFETREESRQYCAAMGISQRKVQKNPLGPKSRRWFV